MTLLHILKLMAPIMTGYELPRAKAQSLLIFLCGLASLREKIIFLSNSMVIR